MARLLFLVIATLFLTTLPAYAVTTVVDGISNTIFAGELPESATSPPQVTGIPINPGDRLRFIPDGSVNTILLGESFGPEGDATECYSAAWKGMAGIRAPRGSLIGVFLNDTATSSYTYWDAPGALDFWTEPRSRNYTSIYPMLRQPFFIGDGSVRFLTDGSILDGTSNTVILGDGSVRPAPFDPVTDGISNTILFQEFVVPAGATRLYLGVMDQDDWGSNGGFFTVQTQLAPLTPSLFLLGSGLLGLLGWRRLF